MITRALKIVKASLSHIHAGLNSWNKNEDVPHLPLAVQKQTRRNHQRLAAVERCRD
jgi:hypothetical protein